MSARALSWRSMVGAAAVSAALLLGVAPATAQAAVPSSVATVIGPSSSLPTVLKRGSTGPYVTYVQRVLGVKRTGYYGSRTKAAVIRFQKASRLKPTGRVGARTWSALQRKAKADAASRGTSSAPPASDPTMTSAMRTSQSTRSGLAFETWLTSAHGKAIARRESGGRCTAVSAGGAYRGKWQMGSWFWKNYGGTKYAATPDKASCLEQDRVAYRGWVDSWWSPWGG
jgi:peptidoglycan hydrolase-like protein with peptidoglycan-binding domain